MRIPGLWRIKNLISGLRRKVRTTRALRAVRQFPRISAKCPHGLDRPLVITLTSYPPRFSHLGKTLRSLLDQTVETDGVVLWLAHGDVASLPQDVRALEAHGLQIRTCDDVRSYKKLVPALAEDMNRYYVTADDDIYYPPDWLRGLVDAAREHPGAITAWRARLAYLTDTNEFAPYRDWPLASLPSQPGDRRGKLFPTGMGGVLYPPHAFDARVTDQDLFLELAPKGDDIWFYWMARLAGTRHELVGSGSDLLEWPTAQASALYFDNALGEGNDRQISAMQRHFGAVP